MWVLMLERRRARMHARAHTREDTRSRALFLSFSLSLFLSLSHTDQGHVPLGPEGPGVVRPVLRQRVTRTGRLGSNLKTRIGPDRPGPALRAVPGGSWQERLGYIVTRKDRLLFPDHVRACGGGRGIGSGPGGGLRRRPSLPAPGAVGAVSVAVHDRRRRRRPAGRESVVTDSGADSVGSRSAWLSVRVVTACRCRCQCRPALPVNQDSDRLGSPDARIT